MRTNKQKGTSIMLTIVLPMAVLVLVQAALFWSVIFHGGTVDELNQTAFDILGERVINRGNYLEDLFLRWSAIDSSADTINQYVNNELTEHNLTPAVLTPNNQLSTDILVGLSENLIFLLRKNGVNDAFVVFEGDGNGVCTGLSLRDSDPDTEPDDYSDLLVKRASSSVSRQLNIPMDSLWSPTFPAPEEEPYFHKPMQAARDYPEFKRMQLGYWSAQSNGRKGGSTQITYTLPLLWTDGTPYGVIGVGIDSSYFSKRMPYTELNENKSGSYLLSKREEDNYFERIFSTGSAYRRMFGDNDGIRFYESKDYDGFYQTMGEDGTIVESSILPLQIYSKNSPFVEEEWYLSGMLTEDSLFSASKRIQQLIVTAFLIALAIGAVAIVIVCKWITDPITHLVTCMRKSDPRQPVQFEPTHIREIDDMASAVETLSRNVANAASRLSRMIEMTSQRVGAFEVLEDHHSVFYTKDLFPLFGLAEFDSEGMITLTEFHELFSKIELTPLRAEEQEQLYLFHDEQTGRWVRLRIYCDAQKGLGVAEDITRDMEEKKKIEYERDYDVLTGLLNRRAFQAQLNELFSNRDKLKIAALVMLDLDNLKYMNDTYGHDIGDAYISGTAGVLKRKDFSGSMTQARISGDEFVVFLYGHPDKESARKTVAELKTALSQTNILLPDGSPFRIRASAGVAWYPDDADSYDALIKFADFAMYTVKNSTKGEFSEFNASEYQSRSFLLSKKEDLNRLIEQRLVHYYFQPIVDAKTGMIYAYEALMRSQLPSLQSPLEILTLAKSQFKLYHIEHLTWHQSLKDFQALHPPKSLKLFINSIADQCITPEDVSELEANYGEILANVVLELTESEQRNPNFTHFKKECLNRWKAELALDDFGSGYNNEGFLVEILPQYIKVDMSIVSGIHNDRNRQQLFRNLLGYAQERGIKVIAEGVETSEDLAYLIRHGIDYMQGYYLGMPAPKLEPIPEEVAEEIRNLYQNANSMSQEK